MRPRTLLSDLQQDNRTPAGPINPVKDDTYERVRRTLNEALAELQLPVLDREDASGVIKLYQPSR
ncbi:MAG: hypothetical protein ACXVCV_07240 [Polyangia bacterium]